MSRHKQVIDLSSNKRTTSLERSIQRRPPTTSKQINQFDFPSLPVVEKPAQNSNDKKEKGQTKWVFENYEFTTVVPDPVKVDEEWVGDAKVLTSEEFEKVMEGRS